MRIWYKYFLSHAGGQRYVPKDETFDDHKRSMQGYDASRGYSSKEEFFKTYFHEAHSRHRDYHDYLAGTIDRSARILSIGSGRCVNELMLADQGFDVTCSDLDWPCREEAARLFRDMKFTRYDATRAPAHSSYDCVVSLSMFYLFDREQLVKVFANIAGSLRPGGLFILDPGGAQDNLITRLIDCVICPLECAMVKLLLGILKKKRYIVTKKHQGYRTTDRDIVSAAGKAGFELRDMRTCDYLTELHRSRLFEKLPDALVGALGRSAPYIRIFKFRKNG